MWLEHVNNCDHYFLTYIYNMYDIFVSLFINVITLLKSYQLASIFALKALAAFANDSFCFLFSL